MNARTKLWLLVEEAEKDNAFDEYFIGKKNKFEELKKDYVNGAFDAGEEEDEAYAFEVQKGVA